MFAKDYNELTHLIQKQHQEIQTLRDAIASLRLKAYDAQNATPATNRHQS